MAAPGSSRGPLPVFVPALLALLWTAGPAAAQYITFGKNKVNYREFEWRVLRTPHFELYFYPEEEALARMALASAEQSYAHHRERFAHEVEAPIPVILYSSHHDFEQTNVTAMLIPEGVMGFTELLRGRVLFPFDGSFYRFFHTLRHELVHAFQRSKMQRVARERFSKRRASHPLWFIEGLAEHWSSRWDAGGDMILRDLVISGKLPPIQEFWRYNGSFALYKLGQSVLEFIELTYGDDKLVTFYSDAWKVRRFDDLFALVLGVTQEELSSRWMHWMRQRYYPDVLRAQPIQHEARQVTEWGMELQPTPVPVGVEGFENAFVFISPQSGYTSIYAATLDGIGEPRLLLQGQRSQGLLSFHAFRSRMDVSPQGLLCFSSHAGDRDILVAYDLVKEEVVQRWSFDDLVGITSPQWDREGRRIVFSGLTRSGECDLYLLDTKKRALERLTWDLFCDAEPALHPDGRRIAFVSDRGDFGREGARNLFLLDLETGELRCLTRGCWEDLTPSWSPDGERLLFVSTRDRMRDLYIIDEWGNGRQVTQALESLHDPRWLPSGSAALASVYHGGRMHAMVIPIEEPAGGDSIALAEACSSPWVWDLGIDSVSVERGKYRPTFALDVAQGGVAVAPGLGVGEGIQILLRDLMGNQLLFMQIGNTTISTSNFLNNFSASLTYFDLSRRVNRGASLFHHAGTYYDELGLPYFERRAGGSFLLTYPLCRFTRLETNFGLAFSEKEKPHTGLFRKAMLATQHVSWIHDTSLWLPMGPIDGMRRHLTLGLTMNLDRPGIENVLLLADARRYLRLGSRSALALRLQVRASGGPDPQGFLLGGSHSLRGYPWQCLHGTRSVLCNSEVRFPLLRGLLLVPAAVGPLSFPGIQGAVFFDAGRAWDDGRHGRWYGSYGFGFRMALGGFLVLRLDLARRTDFRVWPSTGHTEFFMGWNY